MSSSNVFKKSSTIFKKGEEKKGSFFKKTQIFKALHRPAELSLFNFEEIADNDFLRTFRKEALFEEFLLEQTIKNRSLTNVCEFIYCLLFFLNCASSTLYPYFTSDSSFGSVSPYFYIGVFALLANLISYITFELYMPRTKKKNWWKFHNFRVIFFCFAMTLAHIKYLIRLESNSLFVHYKFMYFWGYLQYPLILNMLILLMHGLLIKIVSLFILQSLMITFLMLYENEMENFVKIFILFLSFCYMLFLFMLTYVEEIHMKEKYEFYLNFQKTIVDWKNIMNNVPHGIALFKNDRSLIFSNTYGNEVLNINISSPLETCFETLSNHLGMLQKISVKNTGKLQRNAFKIESEEEIQNTMKSIKKYENSIPEKCYLSEICKALEERSSKGNEVPTLVYKTSDKIRMTDQTGFELNNNEKHLLIKIKLINFENMNSFLLIVEDNSQSELIATLKENNVYKSKLLSSFSHELRTPLNGAMPLLKNLYNDENFQNSDPEKHYQLSIAINSLSILQSVLNDIVDYAQINSNQLQLNCTDFNLEQCISECLEVVSLQIKEKMLDFKVSIDHSLPKRFYTDRNRVSQILLNLLRNAIKFSYNGGKILFSVRLESAKNNIVSFLIKDFGVGIEESELENLKDLLLNIKKNEEGNSKSPFANLGLLISQNLALILGPAGNHSGINIESQIHKGTTVSFRVEDKTGLRLSGEDCPCFSMVKSKTIEKKQSLWRKKRKSSTKRSLLWLEPNKYEPNKSENTTDAILEDCNSVQNIRIMNSLPSKLNCVEKLAKPSVSCCEPILVVDDDPFNLLSAEVLIKKLGYSLVKASNGREAIDLIEKKYSEPQCNPNCKGLLLILMDYNMPVMNGIEATKYLKEKMERNLIPDIPIIACSAFGAKDDIENCFEAGMNDYIGKPITQESLAVIFSKWIRA